MAISNSRTLIFTARPDQAFNALCATIPIEGMAIEAADPIRGTIRFKRGMSIWSWGERLSAQIQPTGPDITAVTISSSLSFGLVDWGRNNRNLDALFARLSTVLTLGTASGPAAWFPDPSGQHPLRWWDGSAWTEQVSDGTATARDPIG